MEAGVLIALGIGLLVTGLAAWFGWKNLEQAKVLTREIPAAMLGNHVGKAVTVSGLVESLYRGSDPLCSNWLWFHKKYQEYRRSGYGQNRSGSWRTVREDYPDYGFAVTLEGGKIVTVHDAPTETYGTEKHTTGGGFGSQSRVITKFYSSKLPMLTVCGKLEPDGDGWRMVRDPKMGLLFTVHTGKAQARVEMIKGWLGLVGVPVLFLAGCVYAMRL